MNSSWEKLCVKLPNEPITSLINFYSPWNLTTDENRLFFPIIYHLKNASQEGENSSTSNAAADDDNDDVDAAAAVESWAGMPIAVNSEGAAQKPFIKSKFALIGC